MQTNGHQGATAPPFVGADDACTAPAVGPVPQVTSDPHASVPPPAPGRPQGVRTPTWLPPSLTALIGPIPLPEEVSDAELDAQIRQMMLEVMPPVTTCLTVIYGVIATAQYLLQPPPVGAVMAAVSVGNASLFLAARLALARGVVTPRAAQPVIFALVLSVLTQALLQLALSPLMPSATVLPSVIVGSAVVFLWLRWLLAFYACAFTGFLVAAGLTAPPDRLIRMGAVVVSAMAIGLVIHLGLSRAIRGLHAARMSERHRRRLLDTTVLALRHAERRLSAALAELRRSNSELEQFASVASHDLKEPLRKVSAYLGLLDERYGGTLDQNARDFIGFARDGARRMQELMDALLAYAREGAAQLDPAEVALDTIVDTALRNLEVAVTEAGAVVTRDPLPTVFADPAKLMQVLQNLLANAIRFRSGARPAIHVSAAPGPDAWTIAVRDNGIGIAPVHHESVFRIFERLNSHDRYPGSGLGLAICKRVVEQHGGRIWVESAPGQGATFRFTLPSAAGDGAAAGAGGDRPATRRSQTLAAEVAE